MGAPAAVALPRLGVLQHLAAHPLALLLRLVPGEGANHAGIEATARGAQVDGAALHRLDLAGRLLDEGDEGLELDGGAVQPVGVPRDDASYPPATDGVEHRLVAGALLPRERRHVVVLVDLDRPVPAAPLDEGEAVLALPGDAEAEAGDVRGDAQVDRRGGFHAAQSRCNT
jgi:hypothetical protein